MTIFTHAEYLHAWVRRQKRSLLVSQNRGVISWLAMAGKQAQFVDKGQHTLQGSSLFALRPIIRHLKEFWHIAEVQECREGKRS